MEEINQRIDPGAKSAAEEGENRSTIESESAKMDGSNAFKAAGSDGDMAADRVEDSGCVIGEKVKFDEEDEEEEDEDDLESWDDHDSFPEFPPGEVPDFLAEIAAKRDSGGRIKVNPPRGGEGAAAAARFPLLKHSSWSSESYRDEVWLRRKENSMRRSKSVTDVDLEELRGCIELGFRFDGEMSRSLSCTIPALDLFHAVNRQYADSVSGTSASDCTGSPVGSPQSFFGPGESPETVKARLKQWAQVVACSLRHFR